MCFFLYLLQNIKKTNQTKMKKTILALGLLLTAACGTPTEPGTTTGIDTTKVDSVKVTPVDTTKVDSTTVK